MSRMVYIGGLGRGQASANRVANAFLNTYFDDGAAFTFTFAAENPRLIRHCAEGAVLVTHEAGLIIARDILDSANRPAEIKAFAPPLPDLKIKLVGGFLVKMARQLAPGIGLRGSSDLSKVVPYYLGMAAEVSAHPIANAAQIGALSRFDSTKFAAAAVEQGIPTTLAFMDKDIFNEPTPQQVDRALSAGAHLTVLPGEHDDLPLRPRTVVDLYFSSL